MNTIANKHSLRTYFYDIGDGKFRWRQERGYYGGETWRDSVKVEILQAAP